MRIFLPLLCCMVAVSGYAQSPMLYGNEWIQYDQKYLKIETGSDAIYRIDYATLDTALTAMGVDLDALDPRWFQLFQLGEEQPIFIEGENDGVFHETDFIEFYGIRNDGRLDTRLFEDSSYQIHTYTSLFTDTAAYFLTWNSSITNARVENLANDLSGTPAADTHYENHILMINGSTTILNHGASYFNPGPYYLEIHSSTYDDGEGFAETKFSNTTRTKTLTATNIYNGADAIEPFLSTAVIATNEVAHHYTISVNGTLYTDTSFTGYDFTRFNYALDTVKGSNPVAYASLNGTTDLLRNAYIDLGYARLWDFNNASKAPAKLVPSASDTRFIDLTDFNEKGLDLLLWDLDAHTRMIGITSGANSQFHLPYNGSGNRLFLTSQDTTDITYIKKLKPVAFIPFQETIHQGNYILISHQGLRQDSLGADWVQLYANYRSGITGGAYQTLVVDVDQLYDQFAYGIKTHPLSIKNFLLFAVDTFAVAPQYAFLIGKARKYDGARINSTNFAGNLVPTFGNPGSDVMLTTRPGSFQPELAIGRLVAYTPADVERYLTKIQEYEMVQATALQTIEDKGWMKNVLHFAGGLNSYEQSLFNTYLKNFGLVIGDTLYGAKVTQFNKVTTDPIFYETSDYIDSLINHGVSLITFFGHSTTGSFDYNIGDPESFTNFGRYNVVFGNGCNTAAIFDATVTLGEQYINAEGKSSVAFIAATTFSLAGSLYNYGLRFYQELSRYQYGMGLGDALKETGVYISAFDNIYDLLTLQHTSLQGDPALRLNTHVQPDYVINPESVFFDPPITTTLEDSFVVKVVVTNIGRALDSNYTIRVERVLPDGQLDTVEVVKRAATYLDTVSITLYTDAVNGVGLNQFTITVDAGDSIAEMSETNNVVNKNQLIQGNDAIPIYPYKFALLIEPPDYLSASTSNPFAATATYLMEIDTTALFNSSALRTTSIVQSGGVLTWDDLPVSWIPNTTYYWRISADSSGGSDLLWRLSSFHYQPGDDIGWSQQHHFQFTENELNNTELSEDRDLVFVDNYVNYQVATGIFPTTDWTEVTSYLNGEELAVGSCAANGFVFFVIDPVSGFPWQVSEVGDTGFGPYGDVYCSSDAAESIIQFSTADLAARTSLFHFMMDTIPDGHYVLCYSNNYPQFNEWLDDTLDLGGSSLFDAFEAYGALSISDLAVYDYDRSYIFYARKGDPSTAFEIIGDTAGNKIEAVVNIVGRWNEGDMTTEPIGPAADWHSVQWSMEEADADMAENYWLEIVTLDQNGVDNIIYTGLVSGDTTLSGIDAATYPYIQLRAYTLDDSLRTPVQPEWWSVIYTPAPEAALHAFEKFVFHRDTIERGDNLSLQLAVKNVSAWDMDSVLMGYSILDAANILHHYEVPKQGAIPAQSSLVSLFEQNTASLPPGNSTLIVEVNPQQDQLEQYTVNNIGYLPFFVKGDAGNPLLDVTFDGIHILDGDIVSAQPEIWITLKDENDFLALSDTSMLDVSLVTPDGSFYPLAFDNILMRFYPADTNNLNENNSARVELNPTLNVDGVYQLVVKAKDATGNQAGGGMEYRIGFEVINKPMISNVLTYPNPFTTQTRFVFTLTGSEVPDYIKVQILTVSGKVIREVLAPELGPLHIGHNITDFAWDGTDAYGDQVGNGLYLYRVVARLNGAALEHFDTGTDQYFESGIGKMYLAR